MEDLFRATEYKELSAMENQGCRLCGIDHKEFLFKKSRILYYQCLDCNFIFSYSEENANFTNELNDYEPAKVLYGKFLSKDSFVFCGRLEGFNEHLIGGKVDVLICLDAIEHMEWPTIFMDNASRVLRAGGMLFLSTPDEGSFLSRALGKWWYQYNKYHLAYFSRKTLIALAAQNGLQEIGFTRSAYFKSMRYILQYLNDFVFGSKRMDFLKQVTGVGIPINLHDMMFVTFRHHGDEN